jgi:hypothetical protein
VVVEFDIELIDYELLEVRLAVFYDVIFLHYIAKEIYFVKKKEVNALYKLHFEN